MPATGARPRWRFLNGPTAVAFDAAGNMYIADNANNLIRKVDKNGIITMHVGGTGGTNGTSGNIERSQRDLVRCQRRALYRRLRQPARGEIFVAPATFTNFAGNPQRGLLRAMAGRRPARN